MNIFCLLHLLILTSGNGKQLLSVDHYNKCGFTYYKKPDENGMVTIQSLAKCYCGENQVTLTLFSDQYCCIPKEDQCTRNKNKVFCPTGKVLKKWEPCNGECHNQYSRHKRLMSGQYQLPFEVFDSFYPCKSEGQPLKCLPTSEMCQGVTCGEDQEIFGEKGLQEDLCKNKIVCIEQYAQTIESLNRTNIIYEHSYCKNPNKLNDERYDIIDRSDEDERKIVKNKAVDFSALKQCKDSRGYPSVQCSNQCISGFLWCMGESVSKWWSLSSRIECFLGDDQINLNDPRLCGNKTIWDGFECDIEHRGFLGKRCTGQYQHCYYPWYKARSGYINENYKQSCQDKSDQVFHEKTLCNSTNYMNMHTEKWCKSDSKVKNKLICKDPQRWLQQQPGLEYKDPHNCWDSCTIPGPNCQACTKDTYFKCKKSDICIHPDLYCDGHPQCPDAEDEVLDKCMDIYRQRNIIKPHASFECISKMYPDPGKNI